MENESGEKSESLSRDVDVNKKDEYGDTKLHDLVGYASVELLKMYFKTFLKGINIDAQNNDGNTPLVEAIINNHDIEVIRFLIDNGANIEIPDRSGLTPLHQAAFLGYIDIVKLLIEHGAKIDVKNEDGLTPLDYAERMKYYKTAKLLREYIISRKKENDDGEEIE